MATPEDYSQGIIDWFKNESGYGKALDRGPFFIPGLDYHHSNEDLNDWYNDWGRFGLPNPLTPGGASTYKPNDVKWDQLQDFFNQRGIDNNPYSIALAFKDFNLMPDSVSKTLSEPAVENKFTNWSDLNDAEFLNNRYQFWLKRDVGQEGLDYWGQQLAGGMSREDVSKSIEAGKENQEFIQNIKDVRQDYKEKGWTTPSSISTVESINKEIMADAREMTPLGGSNTADSITPTETETETETETATSTSGGGGGYKGPSLDDFRTM